MGPIVVNTLTFAGARFGKTLLFKGKDQNIFPISGGLAKPP